MCGGGGGDGGAEAARRSEAENLASIEDARRTLASLYGAGYDYNALDDGVYTGDELGYYGLDPSGTYVGGDAFTADPYERVGAPNKDDYSTSYWDGEIEMQDFDAGAYNQAYDEWNSQYAGTEGLPAAPENLTYGGYESDYDDLSLEYDPSLASTGYSNFLAREDRYNQMRDSILNELIDNPYSGMNTLRTDANKDVKYDMIRRGMVGGSADIQASEDINARYGEGVQDINERADSAVTGARGDDYDRYLRAVRAMEGTGDVQSGLDIMAGDKSLYTNQWLNEAQAKDYSDWFRDIMDMYNLAQYREGQQQGIDQYGNTFRPGSTPSASSGRIY